MTARSQADGKSVLKVLFLSHKQKTYDVFLDRYFVHQYLAAKQHPHVEAVMWGGGFAGFDESASLRDNLVGRFGSVYFDVVFLFGVTNNAQLNDISTETCVMIREHECWDQRCLPYLEWNGVSIGLFAFASDMPQYADASRRRLLAHSPTAAHRPYFYPGRIVQPDDDRPLDVLLVGARDPRVYPLRARFYELGAAGRIAGFATRAHPGYDLGQLGGGPEPDEPGFEQHPLELQSRDYALQLRRAKICLVSTSVFGYAYQKYAEAAMAGCLLVGDIPAERSSIFRSFVVELSADDSEQTIVDTIEWWRTHHEERARRAAIGQQYALRELTWDAWMDRTIDTYNLWQRRRYGFHFPFPFDLTCATENIEENRSNQWC